jgi:hypothetical protein
VRTPSLPSKGFAEGKSKGTAGRGAGRAGATYFDLRKRRRSTSSRFRPAEAAAKIGASEKAKILLAIAPDMSYL